MKETLNSHHGSWNSYRLSFGT